MMFVRRSMFDTLDGLREIKARQDEIRLSQSLFDATVMRLDGDRVIVICHTPRAVNWMEGRFQSLDDRPNTFIFVGCSDSIIDQHVLQKLEGDGLSIERAW
jgi:hypothetical protein